MSNYAPQHQAPHVCIYIYIYMYTYTHTYIHSCMHACMHAYIHTYIHTCIYTYATNKMSNYKHVNMNIYLDRMYVYRYGHVRHGIWRTQPPPPLQFHDVRVTVIFKA